MKKRPHKRKRRRSKPKDSASLHSSLEVQNEIEKILKHLSKFHEFSNDAGERLEDLEIHISLLTRLMTTLCIEKLGMKVGVLKRMIKRIEKEAVRDSQIMHLESLYNLPQSQPPKAQQPYAPPPAKADPWDEIS